jgi:hypothetical protein
VLTLSENAQEIYRAIGLQIEGQKPSQERIRQAASVVFVPGQKPIGFVKNVRSKWESYLVTSTPGSHSFQMVTKAGRVEVQVLICVEALVGKAPREKHTIPPIVAITSFTPKSEPFHDEGKRNLLKGKCTLFANVAEFGGSRAFARADHTSLWFAEKDGSKPVPRDSEALLVIEADIEKQFEIRQSIADHSGVKAPVKSSPSHYSEEKANMVFCSLWRCEFGG